MGKYGIKKKKSFYFSNFVYNEIKFKYYLNKVRYEIRREDK